VSGINITRDEAQSRSACIAVESYHVEVDLTSREDTFASRTTVTFGARPGASTWIDYVAPEVHSIILNGESLDPAVHDGFRIPLTDLKADNTLEVLGSSEYMNTGEGLHRFIDPVDDEIYLYTQFEIADARRVFACFDQPDLKASFQFSVTAPAHWKVVSNSATPTPTQTVAGTLTYDFAPTQRMSTYITAIVAGPYHEVHDVYAGQYGAYPLGLYCRASLAEFLDHEEIFEVTKQGFEFFENTFEYGYPFGKYDQLFVPEFNAGAMENAGCVTHHEDYVFRSKVTRHAYEQRANTVLHEMAHMWFGDLVTMKWWDDLWLNESFAEWAAHHASARATQYTETWTNFVNQRKAWGYRQDQLPTTHPIVADMVDLDAVEVNFDGITYAKGASALRQLVAWVGEDKFIAGIRRYFKKHAWRNTELKDLLVELESASGRDLHDWTQRWLQSPGVNTLRPEITVEDGIIRSFTILQDPPSAPEGIAPTLRPHRIRIGLYEIERRSLIRTELVEVDVDGALTSVPEMVGRKQPAMVLLNDDDLTFTKIRLDPKSSETAVSFLSSIDNMLTRALIWGATWDMARDAELPARDYLRLVTAADLNELPIGVTQQILLQARSAIEQYGDPTKRNAYRDELFEALQNALVKSVPGGDHQLVFIRHSIAVARTSKHVGIVHSWFEGSDVPEGLVVDTDLRWSFVARLVALGVLPERAIDEELERDNTAGGQRQAAAARAGVPNVAAKEDAWNAAIDGDLANAILSATVAGFAHPDQRELLKPFVDRYFDELPRIWREKTNETAQTLTTGLFPSLLASPELLDKADAFLATDTDAGSTRLVRELRDNVARALKCQAADSRTN
jgi:aminopeptidase N